ncbi:hypothetical protein DV736_g4120, partial [Chaetothyriales sp. CBS 134916]
MAYTDDALKAKLSTLNETQDSIVSVSQWIMFHKRHADRIANFWLTSLRDSAPARRLNYIYLVNDIVQNARQRRRTEFPDAFSPLMPEAIQTAYRSSSPEVQQKIRRVIEVWRSRNVFEEPIIQAIESRVHDIDKAKGGGGKKTLMGKSLFSSSSGIEVPKELESLVPLQIALTKAAIAGKPSIDTAESEYAKLNDPDTVLPSPPVYAARLSSLIKLLAAAESSISETIKTRNALILDLQKTLEVNKAALAKDEATYAGLTSRKSNTEAKKREVEDSIMKALVSNDDSAEDFGPAGSSARSGSPGYISLAPEVEELTPEPEERPAAAPAAVLAPEAARGQVRAASAQSLNGPSAKRQKLSHEESVVPDLGDMGIGNFGQVNDGNGSLGADLDADVAELIRQESAKS